MLKDKTIESLRNNLKRCLLINARQESIEKETGLSWDELVDTNIATRREKMIISVYAKTI